MLWLTLLHAHLNCGILSVTLRSCEGTLLASGSADCTVKLWDVNASTKISKTEER